LVGISIYNKMGQISPPLPKKRQPIRAYLFINFLCHKGWLSFPKILYTVYLKDTSAVKY
jgi:hypothetical protein